MAAGALAVLGGDEPEASQRAAAEHLVDRLWVDRMPQSSRDIVGKLAVIRSVDHGPYGVVERGSVWRHRTEIFQWALRGDTLRTVWPQDRVEGTFEVRTYECEDEAPEPFELCLELSDEDHTLTLYSRRGWVIRPRGDGDELVEDPLVRGWLESVRDSAPAVPPPAEAETAGSRDGLWPG